MHHMGDVLAGIHTTWEFEGDSVLVRFERGIRTPKLLQTLRERRIPHKALSSVTLSPGKRGTVVLHAVPRPGADPLMDAAAGQLKESCDPYRLVVPAGRETLAEYYADELRAVLTRTAGSADPGTDEPEPAERYLVTAPEAPLLFKAYDGKASFDGSRVTFRWFWTGASSAKWKAGDQSFHVAELRGVEWRSPRSSTAICGCCGAATARRTRRTPNGRARPTTTRRRWCSGSATAPSTSRCRSPPPYWPPYGARAAARCPSPRRRATRAAPPLSPSGSGIWASCTGRGS